MPEEAVCREESSHRKAALMEKGSSSCSIKVEAASVEAASAAAATSSFALNRSLGRPRACNVGSDDQLGLHWYADRRH